MGLVVSAEGSGGAGRGGDAQQQTTKPVDDSRNTDTSSTQSKGPYDPSDTYASTPFKPAAIYATVVRNSPKLIGWDDAKHQRLAREADEEGRRERQKLRRELLQQQQLADDGTTVIVVDEEDGSMELTQEEEVAALRMLGPDESERGILNEIGFGLLGMAAETVTDYLLKAEGDDGGSVASAAAAPTLDTKKSTRNRVDDLSGLADDALENEDIKVEDTAEESGNTLTMRDNELYKYALNALRWQRDSYLVGVPYADTRKRQRKLEERNREEVGTDIFSTSLTGAGLIPEMSTAAQILEAGTISTSNPPLGQTHLIQLGKWFIPSDTTKGALLPTALWLPGPSGPLDTPFSRAVTNIIPMSQANLDNVLKHSVLWVLQDEAWRNHVKFGASSYVTQMQRDTSTSDDT